MIKSNRHKIIAEIIEQNDINSQEELLTKLNDKNIEVTQATLSRDIKEMKIVKTPTTDGSYAYRIHNTITNQYITEEPVTKDSLPSSFKFTNIGFSGSLAVVKTRPGYAMGIAGEIDVRVTNTVLGTVAGDDTILIIPIEGVSREELINSLSSFIPQQLKETTK